MIPGGDGGTCRRRLRAGYPSVRLHCDGGVESQTGVGVLVGARASRVTTPSLHCSLHTHCTAHCTRTCDTLQEEKKRTDVN